MLAGLFVGSALPGTLRVNALRVALAPNALAAPSRGPAAPKQRIRSTTDAITIAKRDGGGVTPQGSREQRRALKEPHEQ